MLAGRNTYEEHAKGMWGILNEPEAGVDSGHHFLVRSVTDIVETK